MSQVFTKKLEFTTISYERKTLQRGQQMTNYGQQLVIVVDHANLHILDQLVHANQISIRNRRLRLPCVIGRGFVRTPVLD